MSVTRGNVGEHLAMAELLYRGFDAYWADRRNPKFDIACFWNASDRATRLRVKTTSNHSAIWSVKSNGLFLEMQAKNDYVMIVNLGQGLRERDIYIVPTTRLAEDIDRDHNHYTSVLKTDGTQRKQDQKMRCIRFVGKDKPSDHSWGYQDKYAQFREAWDQLK